MKHFKNHKNLHFCPGLSLVEAIIALGMLGILTTSVLVLQQSSFAKITNSSAKLRRIFLINNSFLEAARARQEGQEEAEKTVINEPETTLTYHAQKPAKNSSLKNFNNIAIENIKASWQDDSVTMIHILYKPELEQKGEIGL